MERVCSWCGNWWEDPDPDSEEDDGDDVCGVCEGKIVREQLAANEEAAVYEQMKCEHGKMHYERCLDCEVKVQEKVIAALNAQIAGLVNVVKKIAEERHSSIESVIRWYS